MIMMTITMMIMMMVTMMTLIRTKLIGIKSFFKNKITTFKYRWIEFHCYAGIFLAISLKKKKKITFTIFIKKIRLILFLVTVTFLITVIFLKLRFVILLF